MKIPKTALFCRVTYSEKTSWRKNLYSNTDYDDNYTDVTFLANLKTNVYQKHVSLRDASLGAGSVTEKLCIIFVFFTIYKIIAEEHYSTVNVFLASIIVSGICYWLFLKENWETAVPLIYSHSKTVFLFFILVYLLSPVLKTLTETISSDTINATAIFMMVVHLTFYDYNVPSGIASRAFSLNASIFASICLASRLRTSFDAFVLITISAICFVLFVTFAKSQRETLTFSRVIGLILFTMTMIGLSGSFKVAVFFVLCIVFINVICPTLFFQWQKHKMNIYGPWDEAIIEPKRDL